MATASLFDPQISIIPAMCLGVRKSLNRRNVATKRRAPLVDLAAAGRLVSQTTATPGRLPCAIAAGQDPLILSLAYDSPVH